MKTWINGLSALGLLSGCIPKPARDTTPPLPLEALKEGNARFLNGHPMHPHETLDRIRRLKKGQHPFAVVVSCSDSRVPPELIFDQGLGDIFSVRTAGNVIGDYELGSVEYAVEHLGCKLIVVLGHEDCGAVKAYIDDPDGRHHFDHIRNLVQYVGAEAEEQALPEKDRFMLEKAVEANMLHGVHLLRESEPTLRKRVQAKQVQVVGAIYDLDTGKVGFYEQEGASAP